MQCPKCGYVRTHTDNNPPWQCPSCGIAYNKFQRHLELAKQPFKPLTSKDTLTTPAADSSVWALLGANLFALIIAFLQGWSLAELMLIYWAQSVIIGASYVARIRSLDKFSTKNFKINNKPVEPTESTKRQTAVFFTLHYGFFHFGYLMFIISTASGALFDLGFLLCTVAFAFNHMFSYRYHRDMDRAGTPNIGTLMFTPYIRIVPMHLTIVLGESLAGTNNLLLFGLLKTAADAIMHVVEHKRLGHGQ